MALTRLLNISNPALRAGTEEHCRTMGSNSI
jgi:hypothetical protein